LSEICKEKPLEKLEDDIRKTANENKKERKKNQTNS